MKKHKNYNEIITEDGSTTLFSLIYNEGCHSHSGAVSETRAYYIEGCNIILQAREHRSIHILEVGFGVGVGFLETKKALSQESAHFTFLSFEIDQELIEIFSKKENIEFQKNENIYSCKSEDFDLYIILGNARETIKQVSQISHGQKIHAIYQDAFSPKRNAILWTTQWFEDLLELSDASCLISTYSASSSIRKSMIDAGWKLFEGKKFGTKRSSTRGKLQGETPVEILEKLKRSPVSALTDENYQGYTLPHEPRNSLKEK